MILNDIFCSFGGGGKERRMRRTGLRDKAERCWILGLCVGDLLFPFLRRVLQQSR